MRILLEMIIMFGLVVLMAAASYRYSDPWLAIGSGSAAALMVTRRR